MELFGLFYLVVHGRVLNRLNLYYNNALYHFQIGEKKYK